VGHRGRQEADRGADHVACVEADLVEGEVVGGGQEAGGVGGLVPREWQRGGLNGEQGAALQRRCLVPADGSFEWATEGGKKLTAALTTSPAPGSWVDLPGTGRHAERAP
jgi:hypothetical protein